MEESASFRIMYGWAITKYRSDSNVAFLWEVFNAVVKVGMVASSELMYEKNSRIAQSILIGVSLILHIMVMPYQTTAGNPTWLVIVFGVVDLGEVFFSWFLCCVFLRLNNRFFSVVSWHLLVRYILCSNCFHCNDHLGVVVDRVG